MNKKGVVFTIISLIISTILLVGFYSFLELPVDHETDTVLQKIGSTNSFISQTDAYVGDLIEVTTVKMLNDVITHLQSSTNYDDTDDLTDLITNCFTDGNHAGFSCANITSKMQELQEYGERELNVNFDYQINSVNITQDDETGPWNVRTEIEINLVIDDSYAKWNTTRTIERTVGIRETQDPALAVHLTTDNGTYTTSLNITGPRTYERGATDNVLEQVAVNDEFLPHPLGTKYLDRLQGIAQPSDCCGLVHVAKPSRNVVGTCNTSMSSYHMSDNEYVDEVVQVDFESLSVSEQNNIGYDSSDPGLHDAFLPKALMDDLFDDDSKYYNAIC